MDVLMTAFLILFLISFTFYLHFLIIKSAIDKSNITNSLKDIQQSIEIIESKINQDS